MASKRQISHSSGIIQLTKLVSFCNEIQQVISVILQTEHSSDYQDLRVDNPQIQSLQQLIRYKVQHVETILEKKKVIPTRLPLPSYRAFVWLRFLARDEQLETHLQALKEFLQLSESTEITRFRYHQYRGYALHISMGYIPYIYRVQVKQHKMEVMIHEDFITAPLEIKKEVLFATLHGNPNARKKVRSYCSSDEVRRLERLIRSDQHGHTVSPIGTNFNLQVVFQRVNQQYFNNQLDAPQLTWSQKRSYRRLGSYAPDVDTVTISRAFDARGIPDFAIDFIMYHELLHKKLGVKKANSGKHNHNLKFKTFEKQFSYYEQAEKYLQQFILSK